MPELPDVVVYIERLRPRIEKQILERVRVKGPLFLRTVTPELAEVEGKAVTGVRRLGKRIVLALDDDLYVVLHLMIAGRLHWREPGAGLAGKAGLAAFDFP